MEGAPTEPEDECAEMEDDRVKGRLPRAQWPKLGPKLTKEALSEVASNASTSVGPLSARRDGGSSEAGDSAAGSVFAGLARGPRRTAANDEQARERAERNNRRGAK